MAYNFSEEENKILKFWEENKIFEKSLEQTKDKKAFVCSVRVPLRAPRRKQTPEMIG